MDQKYVDVVAVKKHESTYLHPVLLEGSLMIGYVVAR